MRFFSLQCPWHGGVPAHLLRRFAVTVLLALVLAACGFEPPPPPLSIGTNVWTGVEPLHLARARGYFAPHRIRIVEFTSVHDTMHAYRDGIIDAASITVNELLLLLQYTQSPRVIFVFDISRGADALVAKSHIRQLSDLRNRRIGIETGSVSQYLLFHALQHAQLDARDIEQVAISPNEHEATFLTNRVDAVVTFDPIRAKLLAQGGHILFDSTQLADPERIVDVLIVRDSFLARHGRVVQHMMAGWFRALHDIQQQPEHTLSAMAIRTGLTSGQMRDALATLRFPGVQDNLELLRHHPSKLEQGAEALQRFMRHHALLPREVTGQLRVDITPLEQMEGTAP